MEVLNLTLELRHLEVVLQLDAADLALHLRLRVVGDVGPRVSVFAGHFSLLHRAIPLVLRTRLCLFRCMQLAHQGVDYPREITLRDLDLVFPLAVAVLRRILLLQRAGTSPHRLAHSSRGTCEAEARESSVQLQLQQK